EQIFESLKEFVLFVGMADENILDIVAHRKFHRAFHRPLLFHYAPTQPYDGIASLLSSLVFVMGFLGHERKRIMVDSSPSAVQNCLCCESDGLYPEQNQSLPAAHSGLLSSE